jgi:hypothetical protein
MAGMPATADAVSWQAGAMRVVSAKAGSSESGPESLPMSVPGGTSLGALARSRWRQLKISRHHCFL